MTTPFDTPLEQPLARSSLFRKYTLVFGLLVGVSLLVSGLSSLYLSYQESRRALIALEHEKAQAAAARIGQYIADIEQRIAFTSPPKAGGSALEKRVFEIELLSQIPAITQIVLLDQNGREQLKVSSLSPDEVGSGKDLSGSDVFRLVKPGRPYRSAVHFVRDTEPYLTIAMAVGPQEAGITVAEVNLEFLLDGIRGIKIGELGHAYVVDAAGQIIAHPDLGLVLGRTNLTRLPQVAAALRHASEAEQRTVNAVGLDGKPVLSAYSAIPQLGWLVFAEQPQAEAFAPLYASILQTSLLLLVGLVCAVVVSMALVRKMIKPIQALRRGAMAIGAGSLEQRIEVVSGDELEDLAMQFNQMALHLQSTHAELRRAQQAAEAALRHKSEFLAMITHEMRTPLGGVIGMLNLTLREKRLWPDTRQQIELARGNAQSLLVVLNDVLDVSKVDAGKLKLEVVNFDLRLLVQEALAVLSVRAHDKDLLLVSDLPDTLPHYFQGDPTRLRQIVLNLLGNAVKFTERGEVRLAVSACPNEGGLMMDFTISDTGPGIAPEAIHRLFQKFEQADASTTRRYGGTGLGLAISKELVHLMGGTIEAESELGKGSIFRFRLPLQLGERPIEKPSWSTAQACHAQRLHILCAEDGLTNQVIIRALLEAMGHTVEIVENGLEALQALNERDFDLVLMDGLMPLMDGEEATRRIRAGGPPQARVRQPQVTILALTANAGREDRERYLAAGMDGCLLKPIDEHSLFEAIGDLIKTRGASAA